MKTKLLMLAGVCVLGLAFFGLVSLTTLQATKVGGPHYARISQDKALLADVTSPRAYAMEAYLAARLMAAATSPQELETQVRHYSEMKLDYQSRREFWSKALQDSPLSKELEGSSVKVPAGIEHIRGLKETLASRRSDGLTP